jgi:hypothetical protein
MRQFACLKGVSPSAELIIDPECEARGIIRDTRARGADRFHRSVLAPDQAHTVAAGYTGRIARGRSLAEMAVRAFVEDCAGYREDLAAMADGRLRRRPSRLSRAAGAAAHPRGGLRVPSPRHPQIGRRQRDRERIKRSFPEIEP